MKMIFRPDYSLVLLFCLAFFIESQAQFFLTSNTFLPCEGCNSPFPCGIDSPTSMNGVKKRFSYVPGTGKDYDRDGFSDQWLDIYIPTNQQAPADGFPVMIYAHALGQTANDPCYSADQINMSGVVCVVWESTTENSRTSNGLLPSAELYYGSADSDFQKVLLWVKNQAEALTNINLNLDKVYVSGSSRGTRLSFKDLTAIQSPNTSVPLVKGVIFSYAFPDPEWKIADEYNLPNPAELVEADYPPTLFLYSTFPGQIDDIHDPIRGLEVQEELSCQGIPTSLYYGNINGIFSDVMRPVLLQFIEDPALFISNLEGQVIPGQSPIPPMTLLPPKNVALKIKSNNPSKFKLTWKENNWSSLILHPPYLGCELRASEAINEDFCQSFNQNQVYISSPNSGVSIPSLFSYPSNFMSACNLPANISPGVSYSVQVRCFVRIPGIDYYSTSTTWSEPVSMTFPLCHGVQEDDQKSSDIEVQNKGENRYAILNLEQTHFDYQVFDLTGRTVVHGTAIGRIEIDLSTLSHGLYILRISKSDGATEQISLFKD